MIEVEERNRKRETVVGETDEDKQKQNRKKES
jgi:hypothetical protein